jgi:hypothetical protein
VDEFSTPGPEVAISAAALESVSEHPVRLQSFGKSKMRWPSLQNAGLLMAIAVWLFTGTLCHFRTHPIAALRSTKVRVRIEPPNTFSVAAQKLRVQSRLTTSRIHPCVFISSDFPIRSSAADALSARRAGILYFDLLVSPRSPPLRLRTT